MHTRGGPLDSPVISSQSPPSPRERSRYPKTSEVLQAYSANTEETLSVSLNYAGGDAERNKQNMRACVN